MKIENLFPVQKQVIPIILNSNRSQSIYPNDICVTAPTGSGKTLTYALPIIENLKNRIRPSCRAIVLLPVSDLAEQVYNVFKAHINSNEHVNLLNRETNNNNSNNLKIILLSNKHTFAKEQSQLIDETHGKCTIDIVIATPGRLVDHIHKTKGFNLNELRYLVLDECDRIMDQIKQNWLPILNKAVFGIGSNRQMLSQETLNAHNLFLDKNKLIPYQKLLLSATLTRNPEKLEQINLFQPIFFSVGAEKLNKEQTIIESESVEKKNVVISPTGSTIATTTNTNKKEVQVNNPTENFEDITVPNELSEVFIQVSGQQKSLVAIYLIKQLGYRRMLCFVKSRDTANRLNHLFELNNIKSMEYSSSLHAARRKRIQNKFEKDELDILVCSDVMARGMDLANVDYVLLYDSPKHLSSYIHKVGRTARAGRTGTSITLLEHKEIYFFKKMMAKIGHKENNEKEQHKIKELKVLKSKLKPLHEAYTASLVKLKEKLISKKKPTKNGIATHSLKRNNNSNIENSFSKKQHLVD